MPVSRVLGALGLGALRHLRISLLKKRRETRHRADRLEQTRSLSSSFAAFTAETKARTRSPCSPLNDSPVPPMPRLLGKRPRS